MSAAQLTKRVAGWPVHPLLFATFPVVFLLAQNIHELPAAEAIAPFLLVLTGSACLLLILTGLTRNRDKAALAASILVVAFFSYGPAHDVLQGRTILGIALGADVFLLLAGLAAAGAALFFALRTSRNLYPVTRALNVMALALMAMNLSTLAMNASPASGPAPEVALPVSPGSESRPDVYYLVPERYGAQRPLVAHFDFDNSGFLNLLAYNGFYVAEEATSNYANTAHSLASSLNMDYLDELTSHVERPSEDFEPIFNLIRENRVAEFLKGQGYQYVNLGSWYSPTASSSIADVSITFGGTGNFGRVFDSELNRILYRTTLAWGISRQLDLGTDDLDPRRRHYAHSLWQFEELEKIRDLPGPKFVFAHLSISHDPYVFDREGRFVSEARARDRPYKQRYSEQLEFTNEKLASLLSHLLEGPESARPVIMLQSDEGPFGRELGTGATDEPTPDEVRNNAAIRFPILNAFFMPALSSELYPTVSPVNGFRIVLNQLFDTDLPLLPDKNYSWFDGDLYTFTDLTSQLRGAGAE